LLDDQLTLGVKAARAARRTAQRELVGKPGDLVDVNGVAAFGAADRAADIDGALNRMRAGDESALAMSPARPAHVPDAGGT